MKIPIPLPDKDFNPSEVAVPWKIYTHAGFAVIFATVDGQRAHADPIMLHGQGLDPLGFIPLLKNIRVPGLPLRANRAARTACAGMQNDVLNPLRFDRLRVTEFAALFYAVTEIEASMPCMVESEATVAASAGLALSMLAQLALTLAVAL